MQYIVLLQVYYIPTASGASLGVLPKFNNDGNAVWCLLDTKISRLCWITEHDTDQYWYVLIHFAL